MAGTTISADFYKLVLFSLKAQVLRKLESEARELAEKIIAQELASLTFSVEDLVSLEAGGRVIRIDITRDARK